MSHKTLAEQSRLAQKAKERMNRLNGIQPANTKVSLVDASKQKGMKRSDTALIDSGTLELATIDTSEEIWSREARQNTKRYEKHVMGWAADVGKLKEKADTRYKEEVWTRRMDGKVEDCSSFPTLSEDEWFEERHGDMVVDQVKCLIEGSQKCSIGRDSDPDVWNNMLNGSTRQVVDRLQQMTRYLQEFINDSEKRLASLAESQLSNEQFANETFDKAKAELLAQVEWETNRHNNRQNAFVLSDKERQGLGDDDNGNTPHSSPTNNQTLADVNDAGEVTGSISAPTTKTTAHNDAGARKTHPTDRASTRDNNKLPVTPAFGSGSPIQRTREGYLSIRRSMEPGEEVEEPQESGATEPAAEKPARDYQAATIKLLTNLTDVDKVKAWIESVASLPHNTAPRDWMPFVGIDLQKKFQWSAKRPSGIWLGWETWQLRKFTTTLQQQVVKPRRDAFANTLPEAFNGVKYPLDRINLTEAGLAESIGDLLGKFETFAKPIQTAESTSEGRKQLFNVLEQTVRYGKYDLQKEDKGKAGGKFRTPEDERTVALRKKIVATLKAKTALPKGHAEYIATAEAYMIAVEEEILKYANNVLADEEVYKELTDSGFPQGAKRPYNAWDNGAGDTKRPKILEPKAKCPNPQCGKEHKGVCRTPWPPGHKGGQGQGQGQGQQQYQQKPTFGQMHNQTVQQAKFESRGDNINKLSEKLAVQKKVFGRPEMKKTLRALLESDDLSDDEVVAVRAIIGKSELNKGLDNKNKNKNKNKK